MTGTSRDASRKLSGSHDATRPRAANESHRSSTSSSQHSRRSASSGTILSRSTSQSSAPQVRPQQPRQRPPTKPTPERRIPPRPADIGYQPGDFIGGHEECRPANEDDRAWRAKMAEGAEMAMLKQTGVRGKTLSELRKSYGNKMRFDAFAKNDEALVEYKIAGQKYYSREKPQFEPIEQIRARHAVGVQHEVRMAKKGVENPWSDCAEVFATNGPKQLREVAAVPKGEFDNMYQRCRDANKAPSGDVKYFDIPKNRDDDQWFRVDLGKGRKQEKRSEKRSSGVAGMSGRFAKNF